VSLWEACKSFDFEEKAVATTVVTGITQYPVAMEPTSKPTRRDETEILDAARQGNRAAFEELFKTYRRPIFLRVFRILRNPEDTQDVVQKTFQKAFVHLDRFEGRSLFSTWITRIAINEALMFKRGVRKCNEVSLDNSEPSDAWVSEVPDPHADLEQTYAKREMLELLSLAMQDLQPAMREAVQSFDLRERSLNETAKLMRVSLTAAKSRLCRGRRMLRKKLEIYLASPGCYSQARAGQAGRIHARRRPLTARIKVQNSSSRMPS
jgi:RNA polymerase sigma-70 factor (ECF subfamily)